MIGISVNWGEVIIGVKSFWKSLDSEDDSRWGCQNVIHQQEFLWELQAHVLYPNSRNHPSCSNHWYFLVQTIHNNDHCMAIIWSHNAFMFLLHLTELCRKPGQQNKCNFIHWFLNLSSTTPGQTSITLILVIGQNSYKFNLLPSKQNMSSMQIDTLQLE